MQDLSFHFETAQFSLYGNAADVMVYTFENAYGLDPSRTVLEETAEGTQVRAERLVWAGGQETAAGKVTLCARQTEGRVLISIAAEGLANNVRCVKLTIHGLNPGRLLNKLDLTQPEITREGILLHYPEGWRTLDTPMLVLEHEKGGMTCMRSLDTRVRDKRFALIRRGDKVDAELIFEQYAQDIDTHIDVPAWEIGPCASVEEAYGRQQQHIEQAYGLVPWAQRDDLPHWAQDISLVAAIHCQHWTGYVFNDYDKVLRTLEWIAQRIEGKRVLAYLPGWEGRYYWQYGEYRPDPRMGGEEGFARLCEGARKLGVHLMPMFGINIVNRDLKNFEQWGAPSLGTNVFGESGCGSVDWDGSRHYLHGSNAALNPGAPQWQRRLIGQIGQLADTYDFPAVFLDIAACWYNDPHFGPTNEGVKALCDGIRSRVPGMLVTGEAWYDGLTPAMPVVHSGHTDGPMHYHDALYAPFFDTYMREFAHLCLGDAGRGSSGAHELGTNHVDWKVPLRKGLWPTATIVDDTLEKAPERLEEIIADAHTYAERFLSK